MSSKRPSVTVGLLQTAGVPSSAGTDARNGWRTSRPALPHEGKERRQPWIPAVRSATPNGTASDTGFMTTRTGTHSTSTTFERGCTGMMYAESAKTAADYEEPHRRKFPKHAALFKPLEAQSAPRSAKCSVRTFSRTLHETVWPCNWRRHTATRSNHRLDRRPAAALRRNPPNRNSRRCKPASVRESSRSSPGSPIRYARRILQTAASSSRVHAPREGSQPKKRPHETSGLWKTANGSWATPRPAQRRRNK